MSGGNFIVPPLRWDDIAKKVETFRAQFGLERVPNLPVMDLVEMVLDQRMHLFELVINSFAEMKGAEGYADPNGKFMILRDDVYEAACRDDGRARFTVSHELGHMALHTGKTMLARANPSVVYKDYVLRACY